MAEVIKGYTLQTSDKGTINISVDVLATIAALATTETDGVLSIGENLKYDQIAKTGIKASSKTIRVEVIDQVASVEVAIVVAFGSSIPKVVAAVQDRVSSAITNMTGLDVAEVNVSIIGIEQED